MRRIATWGEFAAQQETPVLDNWVATYCDTVEVLVHVTDPSDSSKAEFFTAPNYGLTVGQVLNRANGLGLAGIINVDWHFGNGKPEPSGGSATGSGKYHRGHCEGGVYDAVRRVLGWACQYNVVAIQIGNEQHAPDEWYGDLANRVKTIVHKAGYKLIVGGSATNMAAAAPHADILDPHLLRDDWRARLSVATDLARQYNKDVWVTEMGPTSTPHNQMLAQVAAAVGENGAISVFTGNRQDFPYSRHTSWNFKNHAPPFQAWSNQGLTAVGRAWQEFNAPEEDGLTVDERKRIERITRRLREKVEEPLEAWLAADLKPVSTVRKALRQVIREETRLEDIAEGDG